MTIIVDVAKSLRVANRKKIVLIIGTIVALVTFTFIDRNSVKSWPVVRQYVKQPDQQEEQEQQSSSIFSFGQTESRQLVEYLANEAAILSDTSRAIVQNYSATDLREIFHIDVRTVQCTHRFTLHDTRRQSSHLRESVRPVVAGGANFRTIATGNSHLTACPYVDHFNGTYDIVCDTYDPVVRITITLMFLDYDTFLENCTRLFTVLWSGRLACSPDMSPLSSTSNKDTILNDRTSNPGDSGSTTNNVAGTEENPRNLGSVSNSLANNTENLGSLSYSLAKNLGNAGSLGNNVARTRKDPGDPGYTGWYRRTPQESWQWLVRDQPVPSECQCRQCLKQDKLRILFLGDSHVRYTFLYTLCLAGHVFTDRFLATVHNKETTVGRFTYIPAHFVLATKNETVEPGQQLPRSDELRSLLSLLRAMQRWKKDGSKSTTSSSSGEGGASHVIIGVGSWDASYRGMRSIVTLAFPMLARLLSQMRDEGMLKTTRVFVLNIPAYNDNREGRHCLRVTSRKLMTSSMSSARAAAVNGLLAQRLAGFDNVVLIDHHAVTVARSNETVDRNHFLNSSPRDYYPDNRPVNVTMVGEIGRTFGRLLVGHICSEQKNFHLQCSDKT